MLDIVASLGAGSRCTNAHVIAEARDLPPASRSDAARDEKRFALGLPGR